MKWIDLSDELPDEGERVLVCNDIREWATNYNPALMAEYVKHPVTHFARYDRPYPANTEDKTGINYSTRTLRRLCPK